ncbi:hypothetical protein LSPH26S_03741 [Lysinibacillus sphaericus]
MQGNTHIVGGITASLAFAQISNDNPFVLVGAGVLGDYFQIFARRK